ncbi:MAG: MBL fold metallo-hydrolase [Christensenellales bacterium]
MIFDISAAPGIIGLFFNHRRLISWSFIFWGAARLYVEAGNTSAYLREGSRLLLLDCGESVFADLLRRGVLSGVTDITVALSHLHSDHCGSLGSLCHYCFYMLHIVPKLVLPEDAAYRADVATLLRLFGVQENAFAFAEDGGALGFSSFRSFRYVPTRHSDGMRCFSFIFETENGGVFFSSDTCTTETLAAFINRIRISNAPTWIPTDADYPGNIHLPIGQIAQVVPAEAAASI